MIVLNIVLTILKIIGITLAVILGLVLFVILSVLLYPVKYKGNFTYKDKCTALIKASWLYHIVTVKVAVCGNKRRVCVKVFGVRLGHKQKKSRKKAKTTQPKPKPASEHEPVAESVSVPEPKHNRKVVNAAKTKKVKKAKMSKTKGKNSIKEKFIFYKNKREEIFLNINDENNKKAVRYLGKLLVKILKHICPKKHKVDIIYGAGEPAGTGKHLGCAYALSAVLGINLCITPDFDNKIFECRAAFKGRLYVIYPAILFLKAYRNKNVRQLITKIKEG